MQSLCGASNLLKLKFLKAPYVSICNSTLLKLGLIWEVDGTVEINTGVNAYWVRLTVDGIHETG
jgi:hypothetical protein